MKSEAPKPTPFVEVSGQKIDGEPVVTVTTAVKAVPVEHLQAMIRLLWPDEITPIAKRQLEQLCEQYS